MKPLWNPSPFKNSSTIYKQFLGYLHRERGFSFADYWELHHWSVHSREEFWSLFWDFAQVRASQKGERILLNPEDIFQSKFFPDALLNYAENLLKDIPTEGSQAPHQEALVFWSEDRIKRRMTRPELRAQVALCAKALKNLGVGKGDRVAGYLPNSLEAIVATLATVSLGAIWSSASPDFGVQGVIDRFGQIEPKVLLATDGYYYNGKTIDCCEKLPLIKKALSSLKKVVQVPLLNSPLVEGFVFWEEFLKVDPGELSFVPVEFNHPLFIMYSSGTTGVPKCIVHGHGGTLLQHLKEHRLHGDIRPGDRLFYFTTLGWMMWNWQLSALASGATLLLYDGHPFLRDGNILFDYAQEERCTHFGTSAKFIDNSSKMGVRPIETHQLSDLRVMFSTGSPLAPESFDYVYGEIKKDLMLSSISGGTDIVSCFMLGHPQLPVYRGEIQCPGLGMDVQIYDENGQILEREKGELVCVKSFPSQPVGFWNDPEKKKYFEAYFKRFLNVWWHGDYVEKTDHGGYIMYGRSDAVLNPGGVRIGTAEIYREVDKLPEILESIVVSQDWQNDVRVVLFVKLRNDLVLTEKLIDGIKKAIRENTTPRHVPAKIISVKDIPRTKSGKITELSVRKVIHGEPVGNMEALANPDSLAEFKNRPELKD